MLKGKRTAGAAGSNLIVGSRVAGQGGRAARTSTARVGATWAGAGLKRPPLESSTNLNRTQATFNELTLSEHDAGAGGGGEEEKSFDGVHLD